MISGLAVLLSVVPFIIAALLPLLPLYLLIHTAYLRSGNEVQRLFAQSQGPLVSHIEESLAGGPTIRAFGESERFCAQLATLNDASSAAFMCFAGVGRWLAVRLEVIGAIISFATTLSCWAMRESIAASSAGLAITWCARVVGVMSGCGGAACAPPALPLPSRARRLQHSPRAPFHPPFACARRVAAGAST